MPTIRWKNTFYRCFLPFWGAENTHAPHSIVSCPSAHASPPVQLQRLLEKHHVVGSSIAYFSNNHLQWISYYGYR